MKDKVSTNIVIKGTDTKKTWEGLFTAKTKLTLREQLQEDEIRRRALGFNASEAAAAIQDIARAHAFLAIRLLDCPDWFKKSNYGLEAEDQNMLVEVHNQISDLIAAEYEALAKEAETAKTALQADSKV